jgi:hypothetical protein
VGVSLPAIELAEDFVEEGDTREDALIVGFYKCIRRGVRAARVILAKNSRDCVRVGYVV